MSQSVFMLIHVEFNESKTCCHCAQVMRALAGSLPNVSKIARSEESVDSPAGKDLRGAHGRQVAPTRQGELVVIVGVGGHFFTAVGVLGVGQECVLEPGYEFALELSQASASICAARSDKG